MLFMPGNNPGMLSNAAVLGADSIILDLEDAVSISEKDAARILVREAVKNIDYSNVEVVVRINPLDSEFGTLDIEEIAKTKPDALMIPKCNEKEIKNCSNMLDHIEAEQGFIQDSIKLIPLIETAAGVENIYDILKKSSRITASLLGAEDLTYDLGMKRTKQGEEIFYARNKIATACRALKVDAIDTPFTDTEDYDGLIKDTQKAKSLGMTGKAAINPRQIDIISSVYKPSEEEIIHALKILKALEKAQKQGKGVFAVDGKMVDAPIISRAERVIESAENLNLV